MRFLKNRPYLGEHGGVKRRAEFGADAVEEGIQRFLGDFVRF